MSAKDVASNMPATPRRPGTTLRVLATLLPFAGGITGAWLALLALDRPELLPHVPRYQITAMNAHGERETVLGVSSDAAREQAERVMSAPDADVRAIRERLAARDAEWRAMTAGPLPPLAPAAECAALLRARADLALALAGPGASLSSMPTPWLESNTLDEADRGVEQAVWLENAASLRRALRAADAAEAVWIAEKTATARVRLVRWRERERSRAEQFQLAAADIEVMQTPFQRDLMAQWQPQLTLELEASAATPLAALPEVGPAPAATPFVPVWALGVTGGLLLGAIPGSLIWAFLIRGRRAKRPERPLAEAKAAKAAPSRRVRTAPAPRYLPAPTPSEAWLHLVSARDARGVAVAACEVAGPFVARGERVLMVDAGRRLKLHEFFGCAPHWGVGECARGEMPLLGSVQRAGVSGLYLLARGDVRGEEHWEGLGDVLDDAHRHFGAVVLALESSAPHAAGAMLGGRVVEAWWGNVGRRLPRVLESLTARVGIVFTPFTLTLPQDDLLEALSERVERLRIASLLAMLDAAEPAAPNADSATPPRAVAPIRPEPAARPTPMPMPAAPARSTPLAKPLTKPAMPARPVPVVKPVPLTKPEPQLRTTRVLAAQSVVPRPPQVARPAAPAVAAARMDEPPMGAQWERPVVRPQASPEPAPPMLITRLEPIMPPKAPAANEPAPPVFVARPATASPARAPEPPSPAPPMLEVASRGVDMPRTPQQPVVTPPVALPATSPRGARTPAPMPPPARPSPASVPDEVIASSPPFAPSPPVPTPVEAASARQSFMAPPPPPSRGAENAAPGARRTPPRMRDDLAAQLIREAAAKGIYLDRVPSRPWLDEAPSIPDIIEASSHPPIEDEPAYDETSTAARVEVSSLQATLDDARVQHPRLAASASETELEQIAEESGLELESDGRTRERLRFLMWMRRVQAEAGRDDVSAVT
jgi:hypothetical protein